MQSILFLSAVLVIFAINGLPVVLVSAPRLSYRELLPAPIVGAALLSILVTVLYTRNVSTSRSMLIATASSGAVSVALLLLQRRQPRIAPFQAPGHRYAVRGGAALAVVILLLLPYWIGGQQFALFQGSIPDSLNYLSEALGFATRSYQELQAHVPRLEQSPAIATAANMLTQRPAVGILYAALYPLFASDVFQNAYEYRLAAQLCLYLAFLYMLLVLFPRREKPAQIVAAAFSVGFFSQYLFDLNAWSCLLALPMVIVFVVDYCRSFLSADALARAQPQPACFMLVRLPILAAGIAYVYPEVLPMLLLCCGGAWLAAVATNADRGGIRKSLAVHLLFAGPLALLMSFFWEPTISFFVQQARFATDKVDWHLFFQAYLLGGQPAAPAGGAVGALQALIITAGNFLPGFFGVYFLQPGLRPDLLHLVWSLLLIALFSVFSVGIVAAVRTELRARQARSQADLFAIFTAGALASLLLPSAMLLGGQYWAAGKALSMLSPLLFIFMMVPLLSDRRRPLIAALACGLVLAHLAFGVARSVVVADHPDRQLFPFPYPTVAKGHENWDVSRYRSVTRDCALVKIEISDPYQNRVVENYLTEHRIPWFSPIPLNAYFGDGEDLGVKTAPEGAVEDCTMSSRPRPPTANPAIRWIQTTR